MNTADLQLYMYEIPAALSTLGFTTALIICLLLLIGILLLLKALLRLWQKRLLAAGVRGFGSVICLGTALLALLLALNIHTYQRLTYEKPLARLSFSEQGPQQYQASLEYLDNNGKTAGNVQEEYLLTGDEWQLDARVLRWKPALQILGLNAMYRLERLNGRYAAVEDEQSQPRSVYALAQERGLDIWTLTRHYRRWLNWVDAYYGSAAYLPMEDGAVYIIVINQSGLVARPANDIAEQAVQRW